MKIFIVLWFICSLSTFGMMKNYALEEYHHHGYLTYSEAFGIFDAVYIGAIALAFGPIAVIETPIIIYLIPNRIPHFQLGFVFTETFTWPKYHHHSHISNHVHDSIFSGADYLPLN